MTALPAFDAPVPLPIGALAPVVTGALAGLPRGDWWVPGLRERAAGVLRGAGAERLADPWAGARPWRIAPALPSPANRACVAVGLALADRERGALVHLGIGSAADGAFHEALNLAALHRPNVIFLVAVHPLDGDSPLPNQLAAGLAALGAAFGIPTATVDGADADAVSAAVAEARRAGGPHLVEARLRSTSAAKETRA